MEAVRGDLSIVRKFIFRNIYNYARENGIDTRKMLKQIIKQEKEMCENSIIQAIRLYNLIEYDVEVSDGFVVTIHARLREVVSPEKLEEMTANPMKENNI